MIERIQNSIANSYPTPLAESSQDRGTTVTEKAVRFVGKDSNSRRQRQEPDSNQEGENGHSEQFTDVENQPEENGEKRLDLMA